MSYGYSGGPQDTYYVDGGESEKSIKEMMDYYYNQSYPMNGAFWQEGWIDKRFKVGDQSLFSAIYGGDDFYKNKRFFFNLIRRHINMICGYQRRNRKSMQTVAVDQEADALSDDFTKALFHVERSCGFQEYFSQSCEGAADVGLGWMHCYLDYKNDPIGGDLAWDNVAYNNCLIDPYFRKSDMSDCNFWWRRRWMSPDAAASILPGRGKDIKNLRIGSGGRDGRFPVQAELINYQMSNLLPYDEFYYLDTRKATMIVDMQTGDVAEWKGTKDELDQILKPWMRVEKVEKPTVKMAVCVGSKVLYDGPNLLGVDRYPVVPTLAYFEPDVPEYAWKIQGVVRNLRDAQYLYNRRKIIELDILESQANSGWIYKSDSVTDTKAFRQSGQGVLIPIKKTAEMGDVQRINAPQVPESLIQLSRSLAEDITAISGVNEELMGSAIDDKAGILAVLRQGAGLTTLQTLFDRWDYSQQLCGRLMVEAMQANYSYGKVQRILGKEPNPRFWDREVSRYDIVVTPGVYSSSQRQMETQQLIYLRNDLQMPVPDETIIRSMQIQNKDQLIEDMKRATEAQSKQAEAQAQAQQEQAAATMQKDLASAEADAALAEERRAKVVGASADMALKLAKAENEEANADLALVKQLVELDNLQIESIARSVELARSIRQEAESKILPQVATEPTLQQPETAQPMGI